jgi:hypothetical protein
MVVTARAMGIFAIKSSESHGTGHSPWSLMNIASDCLSIPQKPLGLMLCHDILATIHPVKMETTNLPKVSRILSSKPVSKSTAFQAIARFLAKEQRRLDPVAIQTAHHLNDVYLVCEALATSTDEKDELERLRNSSTIQVGDETKRFHHRDNNDEASHDEKPLAASKTTPGAIRNNALAQDRSPVAANVTSRATVAAVSERAAVKQEILADEQPSLLMPSHDKIDGRAKRKDEKKSRKKKKRHKNENLG